MDSFIEEVILTNEDIRNICERLGQEITKDYEGKKPILIGMLKGAVPFMAELMKHIKCDMETEYMSVSSYNGGTSSTGSLNIKKDLDVDIHGRDVIIVEDIIDTGLTMEKIVDLLLIRGAKSVEIACLLDKPSSRCHACKEAKYKGYTIEPKFVVGFGLDYDEIYRNLDYIGVLKKSVYEK